MTPQDLAARVFHEQVSHKQDLADDPWARYGADVGFACWRRARAERVALLHDGAAYFAAARSAILNARRSVTLIGWSFDPRTRPHPGREGPDSGESIGDLLRGLKAHRPEVAIRLLIWDMPWPISAGSDMDPRRVRALLGPGIDYRVDGTLPFGACQHQKILVIDDRVAFCGGSDLEANRWDTPAHRDREPRRRLPSGDPYPPRHDVMMLVDGAAAGALGDLARERWRRATGERLETPGAGEHDPWPEAVPALLGPAEVAVARTVPATGGRPAVRESEALYLAAIRSAARVIYLENQYFTSHRIGDALAARLAERDGPEVIVVVSEHSPNRFDRLTMDSARRGLVKRLRAADPHRRLHIVAPHTPEGRPILMHAKVAIFDDRMLRVGSTNLNNRSFGYDTECDLAIAFPREDAAGRRGIERLLHALLAHHAGCPREIFEAEAERRGSLGAALRDPSLVPPARLCPVVASPRGLAARLVEALSLGDPVGTADAWRPWKRPRALARARRDA